jgi:hypothetical protein
VRPAADGTVTLAVVVPGAGTLDVLETAWKDNFATVAILHPARGRFVFARAHKLANRPSTVSFRVKPSARGARLVDNHRYRVTLRLWVTYTPRRGGRKQNISIYGLQLP